MMEKVPQAVVVIHFTGTLVCSFISHSVHSRRSLIEWFHSPFLPGYLLDGLLFLVLVGWSSSMSSTILLVSVGVTGSVSEVLKEVHCMEKEREREIETYLLLQLLPESLREHDQLMHNSIQSVISRTMQNTIFESTMKPLIRHSRVEWWVPPENHLFSFILHLIAHLSNGAHVFSCFTCLMK